MPLLIRSYDQDELGNEGKRASFEDITRINPTFPSFTFQPMPLTTPLWRGLNEKDFCIGYQRASA